MTKYARMSEADEVGVRTVLDVIESDLPISDLVHPILAEQYIQAPSATILGSTKQGTTWSHPDPAPPLEPPPEPDPPEPDPAVCPTCGQPLPA